MTVYVFNWLIVFKSSLLGGALDDNVTVTLKGLRNLREYMVAEINNCAENVNRDESGHIKYPDRTELQIRAASALGKLSGEFKRLKGYYPPAKEAMFSEILDSMDIGGYTYPYTMEVT